MSGEPPPPEEDGSETLFQYDVERETSVLRSRPGSDERYQLQGQHAQGGQARILIALDRTMDRQVAMKTLRPDLADRTAEFLTRFLREARITARLEHPNIVPVHEIGENARGEAYYTMKFVQGRSLGEVLADLRAGRQGAEEEHGLPRRILAFQAICQAVAYAHERGIVHRDLKPGNVMVGRFGQVFVVDWGLAKDLALEDGDGPPVVAGSGAGGDGLGAPDPLAAPTVEGAVIGTPIYMSPEQADGRIAEIDRRSDVYGLGAILYEILTLEPPHVGGSQASILARVVTAPIVAPRVRAPERRIPEDLEAIAMRCLARERLDRYPDARAVLADVERHLAGYTVSAERATPWTILRRWVARNRPVAISVAVAAVVLLVGSVLYLVDVTRAREDAERASQAARNEADRAGRAEREAMAEARRARAAEERARRNLGDAHVQAARMAALEGDAHSAALHLATARLHREDDGLGAVDQLHGRARVESCHASVAGIREAAFGPDGTWILTASGPVARVRDLRTGEVVFEMVHQAAVVSFAIGPAGRRIVTAPQRQEAHLWDVATGRSVAVLDLSDVAHDIAFSPDGSSFAVSSHVDVQVFDSTTGRRRLALRDIEEVEEIAFSTDGRRLVSVAGPAWDATTGEVVLEDGWLERPFQLLHLETLAGGRAARVRDDTVEIRDIDVQALEWSFEHPEPVFCLDSGPEGKLLLTGCADGIARLWNLSTGKRIAAFEHGGPIRRVEFAPDLATFLSLGEDRVVRIWDLATGDALEALPHLDRVGSARFDGSGRRIVTASSGRAWVWDLAPRPPARIEEEGNRIRSVSLDPSGRGVVAIAGGSIVIRDVASGRSTGRFEHDAPVVSLAFEPTGRRMASASEDGVCRVWDLETGLEHRRLGGGRRLQSVAFSTDGQRLAVGSRDGDVEIWHVASGRSLVALHHRDEAWVTGLAFGPEGRILCSVSKGLLVVWDLESGQRTATRQSWDVDHLVGLSDDGRSLVTESEGGERLEWLLPAVEEGRSLEPEGADYLVEAFEEGVPVRISRGRTPEGQALESIEVDRRTVVALVGGTLHIWRDLDLDGRDAWIRVRVDTARQTDGFRTRPETASLLPPALARPTRGDDLAAAVAGIGGDRFGEGLRARWADRYPTARIVDETAAAVLAADDPALAWLACHDALGGRPRSNVYRLLVLEALETDEDALGTVLGLTLAAARGVDEIRLREQALDLAAGGVDHAIVSALARE